LFGFLLTTIAVSLSGVMAPGPITAASLMAGTRSRHAGAMIGIVLTAANPYFLVWWATVGLTLAAKAVMFGAFVVVLFAAVHWLCDQVWLEVLSVAGFKGSEIFGKRAQMVVSLICGIVLIGFGAKFLYDAGFGITAPGAVVS
jgi:threonine/homoserine/homoserine lactone efflux protein